MVLALVDASDILIKEGAWLCRTSLQVRPEWRRCPLGAAFFGGTETHFRTMLQRACSSSAIALYRKTQSKPYLDDAKRIYAWTKNNLRDPSDGLYWIASVSLERSII